MIYYNNQANDLTDMTNGWDYVDTVNTALQSLADAGAISQAWADYAADWYSTEETTLTTYDERQYLSLIHIFRRLRLRAATSSLVGLARTAL